MYNHKEVEEEVLEYWKKNKTYEKAKEAKGELCFLIQYLKASTGAVCSYKIIKFT